MKISLMTALVLISGHAWASVAIPNMDWSNNVRNSSGAAAAMNPRKNINTSVRDVTNNSDDVEFGLFGMASYGNYAAEFTGSYNDFDGGTDSMTINGVFGAKYSEGLSFGAGVRYTDFNGESNTTDVQLSTSYQVVDKWYIGVLVDDIFDIDSDEFGATLALGYWSKGVMQNETLLRYSENDSNGASGFDSFSLSNRTVLWRDDYQFIFSVGLNNLSITGANNSDFKGYFALAQAEKKLNENWFLGLGLNYSHSEIQSSSSDSQSDIYALSSVARYRKEAVQIELLNALTDIHPSSGDISHFIELEFSYFF